MYQRPWEFNITEREIIDTAMGNVDVGPIIYKFLQTGKIEQNGDKWTIRKILNCILGRKCIPL